MDMHSTNLKLLSPVLFYSIFFVLRLNSLRFRLVCFYKEAFFHILFYLLFFLFLKYQRYNDKYCLLIDRDNSSVIRLLLLILLDLHILLAVI